MPTVHRTIYLTTEYILDIPSSEDDEEPRIAEYCKTKNGSKGVNFGGQVYVTHKPMKDRKKNVTGHIWRCSRYTTGCKARIHVDNENRIAEKVEEMTHSHFVDPLAAKKNKVTIPRKIYSLLYIKSTVLSSIKTGKKFQII